MKKWDYTTTVIGYPLHSKQEFDHLTDMGRLGWELVTLCKRKGMGIYYWKKEII